MEELPNKLVDLDQIRINRGLEKICKCENRKFVIDARNRRIICSSCGVAIDPYDAMLDLYNNRQVHIQQLERLFEQRKQIANYKPHLVVIKKLEKQYRGRKTIPCCPRCSEPFYLEELTRWMGKPYADRRIKLYKEQNKDNPT